MTSVRSHSLPGVVPLFGCQALLFWKVKAAKLNASISEVAPESKHHGRHSEAPKTRRSASFGLTGGESSGEPELNGSRHTMFSRPSGTAGFIFRQDKVFFFMFFVCLFCFWASFFLFFTASPDLLTGCWVDRHLRFFCARVLMFHLWGEMAAALIIEPLLICSVRWKEKQLLPASSRSREAVATASVECEHSTYLWWRRDGATNSQDGDLLGPMIFSKCKRKCSSSM